MAEPAAAHGGEHPVYDAHLVQHETLQETARTTVARVIREQDDFHDIPRPKVMFLPKASPELGEVARTVTYESDADLGGGLEGGGLFAAKDIADIRTTPAGSRDATAVRVQALLDGYIESQGSSPVEIGMQIFTPSHYINEQTLDGTEAFVKANYKLGSSNYKGFMRQISEAREVYRQHSLSFLNRSGGLDAMAKALIRKPGQSDLVTDDVLHVVQLDARATHAKALEALKKKRWFFESWDWCKDIGFVKELREEHNSEEAGLKKSFQHVMHAVEVRYQINHDDYDLSWDHVNRTAKERKIAAGGKSWDGHFDALRKFISDDLGIQSDADGAYQFGDDAAIATKMNNIDMFATSVIRDLAIRVEQGKIRVAQRSLAAMQIARTVHGGGGFL